MSNILIAKLSRLNDHLERLCDLLDQVNDNYIPDRSRMNALVAEMNALDAERVGMMVDNAERVHNDQALAWTGECFFDLAEKYRVIAEKLREETLAAPPPPDPSDQLPNCHSLSPHLPIPQQRPDQRDHQ